MRKAAIYRRVSTAKQTDGFSLDIQLERLVERASELGYEWTDFCDPGLSGETLEDRPAMIDLLSRLDEFDAVMVVEESRLARDEFPAAQIRRRLRLAGIRLITLSGETDLTDYRDEFTSGIMLQAAQLEQRIRTHRMITGLDEAAQRGLWTGGPPPYGYRLVTSPDGHTTLDVEASEVAVLHKAVELIIDDGLSVIDATNRLNALGYRTRSGNPWRYRNLRTQLIRRHLIGEIPYKGPDGTIARSFTPLIPRDRYEDLQALLNVRNTGPKSKQRTYPFSGRIPCRCGQGQLIGTWRNDRQARYYLCNRSESPGIDGHRCTEKPRQRRAEQIEEPIWNAITAMLSKPERLQQASEAWRRNTATQRERAADEQKQVDAHISRIKTNRRRLYEQGLEDGLTSIEIRELLDETRDELDSLLTQQAELTALVDQHAATNDDWDHAVRLANTAKEALHDADLETQATVLDLLQLSITPAPEGYSIEGKLPDLAAFTSGKVATEDPQHP